MRELKVKIISNDDWSRKRVVDEKGRIFTEVSYSLVQDTTNGLPGDWRTTSKDGVPQFPIAKDIILVPVDSWFY